MIYKCSDKKSVGANNSGETIKNEIMLNQELAELNKTIIRKFEKVKCTHPLRITFKIMI